ncbi:TetR/AcrR family transcriptional regulator [Isobaculum melis]|uniref:DNA-binding transcriptional regulator, AcrR family n=1 Tax=Isobaculum melis TaxID=142588 RepID=A0A1H9T8S6_9LACT|nr:TetR/AcrR family transcriptional regulator [Isobaculum melis]SER93538.1 DNA-binding transcriptional regulator, AcrR family [Isobaculum melis]
MKNTDTTREAILSSALSLFLEKGYTETSTNDIRIKAGNLSRGGLYHHFPKKIDILRAIPEYLARQDTSYQEIMSTPNLSILEKLRLVFIHECQSLELSKDGRSIFQLLSDVSFADVHLRYNENYLIPLYESMIIEGNKDGSVHVKNARATAEIIALLLNQWCIPSTFKNDQQDINERLDLLSDMLNLLGVPLFNTELKQAYCQMVLCIKKNEKASE